MFAYGLMEDVKVRVAQNKADLAAEKATLCVRVVVRRLNWSLIFRRAG